MELEVTFQRSVKGHQGQGKDEGSQHDVRDQKGKINRTHPTLSGEGNGAYLVVVIDVGSQEEARGKEGCDHRHPVRADVLSADEKITGC